MARIAVKSWRLALIGATALGAYLPGVTEPVLLFAAAAVAAVLASARPRPHRP